MIYREISSLKSYVLVEQDQMLLTVFRRTPKGWKSEMLEGNKAVLRLPEIRAQIPLERIYARTAAGTKKRRAKRD